jgi:7,8-dihydroneopterin aldolase/epimerase/oxygenase
VTDRPADRIELRGLRLLATVGVLDHEQVQAQPIEVDLDVAIDLAAAGRSDDLADTVDYGSLCARLEDVASRPRALLEAMAEQMAQAVLDADPRVAAVEVAVRKLRPPVPQQLATSGVRVVRARLA